MDREQRAKAAVAAGLFIMVLVAVFSFWFVLPSMDKHQAAYAQDDEGGGGPAGEAGSPGAGPAGEAGSPGAAGPAGEAGSPGAAGPGGEMAGPGGGMGGGMAGPGGEMGMGGGMGGPGGAMGGGAPAAAAAAPAPPLEPSRANPFVPLDVPEAEDKFVTSRTKYGPDWSTIPIGYTTQLPQPQIPTSAAPVPIPPNPSASADLVRVSAIVWPSDNLAGAASGRAFATWEAPDGRTRLAKPGQELAVADPVTEEVQRWRVVSIERDGITLRNVRTGETVRRRAEPRTRSERKYYGRQRIAEDYSAAQADGRKVPGASMSLPGAAAPAAAAQGAGMGPEGGMGEMGGMPGMPGMAGGMGMAGPGGMPR